MFVIIQRSRYKLSRGPFSPCDRVIGPFDALGPAMQYAMADLGAIPWVPISAGQIGSIPTQQAPIPSAFTVFVRDNPNEDTEYKYEIFDLVQPPRR